MNRLKEKPEEDREPDGAGTYFYVSARCGTWYVSTAMARHIEACLDAEPRPAWLCFVDLTGARVRVRTRDVEYLNQDRTGIFIGNQTTTNGYFLVRDVPFGASFTAFHNGDGRTSPPRESGLIAGRVSAVVLVLE